LPEWTNREQEFAKALQKELGVKETGFDYKIQPLKTLSENDNDGSSTDVGEVTMVVPTATLYFPGEVPGAIGHHWSMVSCNWGSAAWKGLNTGARVIAATAIDLLTKPKLLESIRREFSEQSIEHPYKSFLPDGAKPPLDLNKVLMNKYRDTMMKVSKEAD
jgi:aminobenzoyl-glutamate utilization protein B